MKRFELVAMNVSRRSRPASRFTGVLISGAILAIASASLWTYLVAGR